jgi:hypothetical protein
MQFLAAAFEQRFIGGVAYQRVLELIRRLRRDAAHIEQFGVGQSAQRALQVAFHDRMDRVEYFIGKLTANYRPNLYDLLGRPEPIQARHQRIVQCGRNLASGDLGVAAFEHRAR